MKLTHRSLALIGSCALLAVLVQAQDGDNVVPDKLIRFKNGDLADANDINTNFSRLLERVRRLEEVTANSVSDEEKQILSRMRFLQLDDGSGRFLDTIQIDAANLRVVNGEDDTLTENGLGNLIVGYNELREDGTDARLGSHNIVGGSRNNYTGHGGLVVGSSNEIAADFSSVVSGSRNTASGFGSSVSSGSGNTASGYGALVGTGYANTASGTFSNVAAGQYNTASGVASFVGSGTQSEASGFNSAIIAGSFNAASGGGSFVGAGRRNDASGEDSAILGGADNTATNTVASVSGGRLNDASGYSSAVGGGFDRDVSGTDDWRAGDLFQEF